MTNVAKVSDVMSREVITFSPDDTLRHVAIQFEKYNFDGFPVVDKDRKVLGIVTAYDMVLQSSKFHLPGILAVMGNVAEGEEWARVMAGHFEQLRKIKAREVMNKDPLVVAPDVSVEQLAKEFVEHHRVNPIPVIGTNRELLGVVSRFDIIRFFNEQYFRQIFGTIEHGGVLRPLTRVEESF